MPHAPLAKAVIAPIGARFCPAQSDLAKYSGTLLPELAGLNVCHELCDGRRINSIHPSQRLENGNKLALLDLGDGHTQVLHAGFVWTATERVIRSMKPRSSSNPR
jgi:hypothetical protein